MNADVSNDATPVNWGGPLQLEQAIELIDYGVLLKWRNMRTLKRTFSADEELIIIRQFAKRLTERAGVRLQTEILVESVLIWLANSNDQKNIDAFLEEILASPDYYEACWAMVEVSLTAELVERRFSIKIFEMAVAVICELGKNLHQLQRVNPASYQRLQPLLDFVATYLVSVSNKNSSSIRLSLLHYFGVIEHNQTNRSYVNKILMRFGHTVLDQLFFLLFRKRSESIALQFLLDTLPFVLEADFASQKIVYETFKTNMLKKPERFCLFLNIFADHIAGLEGDDYNDSRKVYLKHLGALLKVASQFNSKTIGSELINAALKLKNFRECEQEIALIQQDPDLKDLIREKLQRARALSDSSGGIAGQFRSNKRGRKPSFAKQNNDSIVQQVHYLGAADVQKAS